MKAYRTVPFNPQLDEKQASKTGGETIAKQLGEIISREASEGWVFEDYETVQVTVNPGCLSILGGGKANLLTYGVVIFSREG